MRQFHFDSVWPSSTSFTFLGIDFGCVVDCSTVMNQVWYVDGISILAKPCCLYSLSESSFVGDRGINMSSFYFSQNTRPNSFPTIKSHGKILQWTVMQAYNQIAPGVQKGSSFHSWVSWEEMKMRKCFVVWPPLWFFSSSVIMHLNQLMECSTKRNPCPLVNGHSCSSMSRDYLPLSHSVAFFAIQRTVWRFA